MAVRVANRSPLENITGDQGPLIGTMENSYGKAPAGALDGG